MYFHLGSEPNRPTIAARLTAEDLEEAEDYESVQEQIQAGLDSKLVAMETNDHGVDIVMLLRRLGRQSPAKRKLGAATIANTISALTVLNQDWTKGLDYLSVGTSGIGADRRLALSMQVTWPEADESRVQELATSVMRQVGRDSGYPTLVGMTQKGYEESVYASVNRRGQYSGVTLQTLPLGSCSINTIGDEYEPENLRFMLDQHNLYTHHQQLICLSGAIAIARADDLLNTDQ